MNKLSWIKLIIYLLCLIALTCLVTFIVNTIKRSIGEKQREKVINLENNDNTKTEKGIVVLNSDEVKFFKEKEEIAAEEALKSGITVEDGEGDFIKFPQGTVEADGRPNNTEPYPLKWTDYKSLKIGADEKYIYIKHQFWGILPVKPFFYKGDFITGLGAKVDSLSFINVDGKQDTADLASGIMWEDKEKEESDRIYVEHVARISPSGIDYKANEMMHKTDRQVGMVGGGPGTDYLLAAFPLSLFNLKLGDEVTFDAGTETESKKYHHEAADLLLEEKGSKFGITIKFRLGSNQYQTLPNYDKQMHE